MPGFDRYIRDILATGEPPAADPAPGSVGAGRRQRELPPGSDGGHDVPKS